MEASRSADPVLNAGFLEDEERHESAQLFYWHVQTCRGQALDVVVNSGEQDGIEAWRALCTCYEPNVRARYAGQLMGRLQWDFSCEIITRLEAFDREGSLYAGQR